MPPIGESEAPIGPKVRSVAVSRLVFLSRRAQAESLATIHETVAVILTSPVAGLLMPLCCACTERHCQFLGGLMPVAYVLPGPFLWHVSHRDNYNALRLHCIPYRYRSGYQHETG